jgi:hypothetical protein
MHCGKGFELRNCWLSGCPTLSWIDFVELYRPMTGFWLDVVHRGHDAASQRRGRRIALGSSRTWYLTALLLGYWKRFQMMPPAQISHAIARMLPRPITLSRRVIRLTSPHSVMPPAKAPLLDAIEVVQGQTERRFWMPERPRT